MQNVGAVDERGPAVDEVGVESVAGRVAVRPDPGRLRAVVVCKVLGLEDELVEERDEVNRVRSRTVTAVDAARWPGHVGPVVGRVEIDTVPTVWEVDLSTDTLRALVVSEEAVSLVPLWVAPMGTRELETDVGDGLVVRVGRGKVPSSGFTGQHSKTVGESVHLLVLVARSRKVVGVHVVDWNHRVRLVRGVVVVQLGDPVV